MIVIEIDEWDLYKLLSYAKEGIQKDDQDYTPELAHAYKELASRLPEVGYEYVKDFANTLHDVEEDYPLTWEDDDYDCY